MSSDLSVEYLEDDYTEAEQNRLAEQASIDVVENGTSMSSAISGAQNRFDEQREAIAKGKVFDTPSGCKHEFHNPELNDLDVPKGKEKQVWAIAQKIKDKLN